MTSANLRLPVTLVALAFLGVAMPLLPSAAASSCSTSISVDYGTCEFTCGTGQNVQARGSGLGVVSASCGGGYCTSGPSVKLNPTCSFITSASGSGVCTWRGTGSANCHN